MKNKNTQTVALLSKRIEVAVNNKKADLVIKNAKYLNVFTEKFEEGDIAVKDGYIVGVGDYSGIKTVDAKGKYIVPSFIDGHIHLESAIVSPANFRDVVIPHGTGAVIVDPQEIANVAGTEGIKFILDTTENLDLDVYVMISSCVPATNFDEAGAKLDAKKIKPFYKLERVLGLAEFMNYHGICLADKGCLEKCVDAINEGKLIDGHAPSLNGKYLDAYVSSYISTDHECVNAYEGIEKLSKGQWIEIRQGTACHDLKALMPLLAEPYYKRCLFSTDDKHPGDIIKYGHIDYIIRKSIEWGADPIKAYIVSSYNAAVHYGLKFQGAIAPGYVADLVVLDDINKVKIDSCYKRGILVSKDGKPLTYYSKKEKISKAKYKKVYNSFNLKKLSDEDFKIKQKGKFQNAIEIIEGGIVTKLFVNEINVGNSEEFGVDLGKDIIKLAVVERHKNTGHIGLGFIKKYGLKKGAVASSVAHDSHNIVVAGTNSADMALAANTIRKNKGGLAVCLDGKVLGEISFEIAGLMTSKDPKFVEDTMSKMKEVCYEKLGVNKNIDPFMTLAFMCLPVIPDVKLTTFGLVDVNNQEIVESVFL